MTSYYFGPQHPLNPERLRRTVALLEHYGWETTDPGAGQDADILRVHDPAFVETLKSASHPDNTLSQAQLLEAGLGTVDVPIFPGMYEASLAYVSGSARAAEAVRDGSTLAFGIAGGLHHARRTQASGFCVFNDCSVACAILKERFSRIAYIDIDVHHGDGVQWMFYDDPSVITCSIHQDGRTIYPGSGGIDENRECVINMPLRPYTEGAEWLDAFRAGIMDPLRDEGIEVVVLQMGCDSHRTDPLARINNDTQHWLQAVRDVASLNLPVVALGGGGYDLSNVPRMWAAACLTLNGQDVPNEIPEPFATEWGVARFHD